MCVSVCFTYALLFIYCNIICVNCDVCEYVHVTTRKTTVLKNKPDRSVKQVHSGTRHQSDLEKTLKPTKTSKNRKSRAKMVH